MVANHVLSPAWVIMLNMIALHQYMWHEIRRRHYFGSLETCPSGVDSDDLLRTCPFPRCIIVPNLITKVTWCEHTEGGPQKRKPHIDAHFDKGFSKSDQVTTVSQSSFLLYRLLTCYLPQVIMLTRI